MKLLPAFPQLSIVGSHLPSFLVEQVGEAAMVKGSKALLCPAADAVKQALSDFLVCPLSKQPLRYCERTQSLVSDALGVSYPIVDGIPCLVPKDGKLLDGSGVSQTDPNSTDPNSTDPNSTDPSSKHC